MFPETAFPNTITNSMYETLVWFDENLELKPLLAKSWTVLDDGLDYTFVLMRVSNSMTVSRSMRNLS